jgi:hypothetical protein
MALLREPETAGQVKLSASNYRSSIVLLDNAETSSSLIHVSLGASRHHRLCNEPKVWGNPKLPRRCCRPRGLNVLSDS